MEEEIKQKKKKSKAFTLIELLAVITIMAILMLIAIPAVSRVIFNSRRDTYVATVKNITDDVKRDVICCFKYDDHNNVATFFSGKNIGIATNIISLHSRKGSPTIKKLIEELNEWYNKVISLGGEKYAEILL